jgi:hypothetical protein
MIAAMPAIHGARQSRVFFQKWPSPRRPGIKGLERVALGADAE